MVADGDGVTPAERTRDNGRGASRVGKAGVGREDQDIAKTGSRGKMKTADERSGPFPRVGAKAMNDRRTRFGLVHGLLLVVALAAGFFASTAVAQRPRAEPRYEYKVITFSYNPGERLTSHARAAAFERVLNDHAREGWEPVANLLDRTTIQTIGGGVTTRDTTSFVAFRRPR
jgi:hypothetical protein